MGAPFELYGASERRVWRAQSAGFRAFLQKCRFCHFGVLTAQMTGHITRPSLMQTAPPRCNEAKS
jgi:hypothetical protein